MAGAGGHHQPDEMVKKKIRFDFRLIIIIEIRIGNVIIEWRILYRKAIL